MRTDPNTLLRQNRELAYSRSLLTNHASRLQLDNQNLKQENARLREALCAALHYQSMTLAVIQSVVSQERDPQDDMHDPSSPLTSASESDSSPVTKSSAMTNEQQRVAKETKKYMPSLSPIVEQVQEQEPVSQQQPSSSEPPLCQSRGRRNKVQKSYRLPSLKQKLRKGDPFTYT